MEWSNPRSQATPWQCANDSSHLSAAFPNSALLRQAVGAGRRLGFVQRERSRKAYADAMRGGPEQRDGTTRSSESTCLGYFKDGDYTVVEYPEPGNRGLVVRRVAAAERRTVWRWDGFLFATAEEAQEFANRELVFGDEGPPHARQAFSHKRVDGLRIYVHLGQSA